MRLQSVGRTTLTPLVRQALDSDTIEITSWQCQEIHGGAGGSEGVYRFAGSGRDRCKAVEWSLILKVIRLRLDRDDPSGWGYWKRELLVHQSGLLDDLPGGLAAPRCLGIAERPEGEFWLLLEDVVDEIGSEWPLEHYAAVARHLGRFNGAYLLERPIPSQPWLSRGLLRSQLTGIAPDPASGIAQLRTSLEHPLVHRVYSPDIAAGVFRLWAERDMLLDALERLSQTFCHLDAFRRNLFARHAVGGCDRTVAIDWACVGMGAVGEEIVPLVVATLFFREVEWDRALELEALAFDSYLEGLREAGWLGDPRAVRFAYTAASALRFGVAYTRSLVSVLLDESRRVGMAQLLRCPAEEVVDHEAKFLRFMLTLGNEAWELLDEL
jgi:hypothetical protein